jgi:hypothetical protein
MFDPKCLLSGSETALTMPPTKPLDWIPLIDRVGNIP